MGFLVPVRNEINTLETGTAISKTNSNYSNDKTLFSVSGCNNNFPDSLFRHFFRISPTIIPQQTE
jgi:hypothetical protein